MAYKHRNIPVTSKEEVEIQTDVKLLDNHYFESQNQDQELGYARSPMREKGLFEANSLLRPFSDHELLRDFHKCVREMKDQPYSEAQFTKRLEIIEHQINGLLKRDYLISTSYEGSETWSSYYSALNQKEKDVVRLGNEKIYSDRKIARLENRIKALEEEVGLLRVSLVHSTEAVEENKLYASMHEKMTQIITASNKKGSDIEKMFEEQMLPVYTEFNMNLGAMTRLINKETTVNTRPLVQSMAKEFDRLLKEQQFTEDRHSDTIVSLLQNFKAVKGVDYLREQFDLAQRAETAENNYKNMLSLFKHEIQSIQASHPHLKGAEKLDWLTRKLEDEGIDLIECNGWVNLAVTEVRVHEVQSQDTKLRELLGILSGEFKRVYLKFPELKNHCSSRLVEIFQSEVLVELIEGASLERLKEIIVHEVKEVRVADVYQYESSKEVKMIFHLRMLLKTLLEEMMRCRTTYGIELSLDESILILLRDQCSQLNVEEILEFFRPPAKNIEVPIVLENKVYESSTYEKGVAIEINKAVLISEEKQLIQEIKKEVPIFIERAIECIVKEQVPLEVVTEKLLEVPTYRDVIVDRIVETGKECPVVVEKVVAAYEREEVVVPVEVDKIIRDLEIREVEKIVEVQIQKIVEVQTVVEKLVTVSDVRQVIREVEVKVPFVVTKTDLIQIEKKIPYIIEQEKEVELRVEVPIEIKVPELQYIEVCEYRDKPIVVTNTVEKTVPIELKVEKELVREVPKEIYIDRSHFIKGDKEETVREVEVFIDKPIIQEVMITRDVEIEKVVPLYIKEEVPVTVELRNPYISERVQEIEVQKPLVITAVQDVIKIVNVDRPVKVIVEQEVVKVQPQIIEKVVEKIVEVPRVVEVEKIVEKIVVVPRIIEKIVEVPIEVEKIVVCYKTELQIVEIPVPEIIIQRVEVPVEVEVIKTVIVKEKEYEQVEVDKLVELKVYEEKPVEIEVERRVPYPVIKEVQVQTYRDRIEYQTIEIHETKVQPIEVQVPFIVQEKVPFIVEKEVKTHDIIKELELEKIYTEKEKIVIVKEEKLVIHENLVEKAIIHREVVEVPTPDTIVEMVVPEIHEVELEKIVQVEHYVENIKEVIIEQDKVVPIIHEKIVSIAINELVTTPELIEVPKIVNLTHYKEVLVGEPVREERMHEVIVEVIKPVDRTVEVPTEIEITREKIREITKDVIVEVRAEVVKEIYSEVEVLMPTETQIVELPGETIVQQLRTEIKTVEIEERLSEKMVEKIIMLPQIVEIIKNIHHVSEVNQLGIAIDVDINVQVQKFAGVSVELKKGLVELLTVFKSNAGRQPDLKNLIVIIEKYMKFIDSWIEFPKLVEVQKLVDREVIKEKLVVVPTENKEREATLSFMMEKMIVELRRVKEAHKISLNLDDDLQRLFFTERVYDEDIEKKVTEMKESLISRTQSIGSLNLAQPFVINSTIDETLRVEAESSSLRVTIQEQQEDLERLRRLLDVAQNESTTLKTVNSMMVGSNNSLIKTLEKHKEVIGSDEFETSIKGHQILYDDLIQSRRQTFTSSTIQKSSTLVESAYVTGSMNVQESVVHESSETYVGELVSKLSKYETDNQMFCKKSKVYESEITRYTDELNVKNSIIKRLENDFEGKLSRAREELSKNPTLSQDLSGENKRLQERTRHLEKECAAEKAGSDKAKRELDRAVESQKRDAVREQERKDRENRDNIEKNKKEAEREIQRITADFEKIKKNKEKLDIDISELRVKHSEEIKTIREQQLGGATDKHNQLLNENIQFRKKYDSLEVEYEKLKRAAVDNNSSNDRETHKLKVEIEKLTTEKKELAQHSKEGFMDLPAETKLINVKIELEKKIKIMESDLSKYRNKDESSVGELRGLREKVKNLEVELEIAQKELEASHKMRETTFKSGYKSVVSSTDYNVEGAARSPKGYFKSGEEKRFVSPQSVQSEERIEEMGSSSSRFSRESVDERLQYKSQMTLKEFNEVKHSDQKDKDVYTTFVMIKIIEAIQKEAENAVFNSYSPSNIYLHNFDAKHLDRLNIKFGAHIINKLNRNDGLYLAPEVLGGSIATKKTVVFCLGVILDELIHGSLFFRSMEEIQNENEFKVRGEKLNPILKNTLFEMMNKEPSKRLELIEAKRRLSLQKYITVEGRSSVSTHTRVVRRQEE